MDGVVHEAGAFEIPGLQVLGAPVWREAHGTTVTAADGREFTDMAMAFGAAAWGHGTVLERLLDERGGPHGLPSGLGDLQSNDLREQATEWLCRACAVHWAGVDRGEDLRAVVLLSGSEAVETALKTALLATGRSRLVSFDGAYHGTFGLALAVTSRADFRAPFAAQYARDAVRFAPFGDLPRLDESVAAVIVEPIQGRAGVILPPDGFLAGLRAECSRVGALLILDDVMVGAGRAGSLIPGAEVGPDIVCLGKALGGGVPASAVVMRSDVAHRAWAPADADAPPAEAIHTATFLGHPLACAAICEVLDLLGEDGGASAAERIEGALQGAAAAAGVMLRGRGAVQAIDTHRPGGGVELATALQGEGVIAVPSSPDGSTLTLTPALNASGHALETFTQALTRLVQQAPTRFGASAG